MRKIIEKADENYNSFLLLKDAGNYNSCIHCAYYSAFQYTIASLCKRFGQKLEDLNNDGKDSHSFVINLMINKLFYQSRLDVVKYKENIWDLKSARKKADYTRTKISEDVAISVQEKLDKVISLIKDKYL